MFNRNSKKPPPIPENNIRELVDIMTNEITQKPPTIGLIGVSGVGKSSTINTLFRTNLATSDTVACTKQFKDVDLSLQFNGEQIKSQAVNLRVIDAPGLGEDIFKDPEYLSLYNSSLDRCDVILWVMSARNRAIALDQQYLQKLSRFHDKMVFAINQVDIVEPMDWRDRLNIPSKRQEENIKIIQEDRAQRIKSVLGRDVPLVSYSSKRGYRLELLFKTVLESCPLERQWIFEGLKNFSHWQFYLRRNPE